MSSTIQIGDITPRHIGQTFTVTETGGNVITGTLTNIYVRATWKTKEPLTSIKLETANGEYSLNNAEADYLLQLSEPDAELGEVEQ